MRRDRLRDAVINRRAELGLSQEALAKKAGVGVSAVQAIEAARVVRKTTLHLIEVALEWTDGAGQALLEDAAAPQSRRVEPEVTDSEQAIDDAIDALAAVRVNFGNRAWAAAAAHVIRRIEGLANGSS